MSEPYVGEIRIVPYNFAPVGWAFCDGQLQNIADYFVLFQLIGTTYGGDGVNTFALPDMRGRAPVHAGDSYSYGETSGVETVTISEAQLPTHSHLLEGDNAAATSPIPTGHVPAAMATVQAYAPPSSVTATASVTSPGTGGSQPHDNMQPFQTVSYIISLFGVFPSQN